MKLALKQLAQLMDAIPGEGWPRRATQAFWDVRSCYLDGYQTEFGSSQIYYGRDADRLVLNSQKQLCNEKPNTNRRIIFF